MNNISKHEGDPFEINDQEKWTGQEVGVNSNIPLVDAGTGKTYIIRQFEYYFSPELLIKIESGQAKMPTRQELFNSNAKEIEVTLWKDGLVPYKEISPKIALSKKKYKIVVACEARTGNTIVDKISTLQEITKPVVKK